MLTAYFDESRTDDGQPYPVVAGFIGEVRQWRKFEKAWRSILADVGVTAVHAKDLIRDEKQFKGWAYSEKDRFIRRLLKPITRFPSTRISASVRNVEYLKAAEELTAEARNRAFASQYEVCGVSCFVMCAHYAKKHSYRERIATVFDEGNQHQVRFKAAHKQAKQDEALAREYLLGGLTFDDDRYWPELQAADLFAWSLSRVLHDTLIKKAAPHPLALLVVQTVWTRFRTDGLEHLIRGPVIKNVLQAFGSAR